LRQVNLEDLNICVLFTLLMQQNCNRSRVRIQERGTYYQKNKTETALG